MPLTDIVLFTNWRQDPPPAKRLWPSLLWWSGTQPIISPRHACIYNVPFTMFSHSRFLKHGFWFPKQPSIPCHDLEEPESLIDPIQCRELWLIEMGTELASGVKWPFSIFFHFYLSKIHLLSNKTRRSLGIKPIKDHLMSLYPQQTFIEINWVMLGFSGLKF